MSTIVCAVAGYFTLLLVVRLLTRRPGGQLTLFEFVIVILVGGVAIGATVGDDRSATNCVSAILTIGLLHRLVSRVRNISPRLARILDGTPLLLIKEGRWQSEVMRGMRIDPQDVMSAARGKGVQSIFEIQYAILERNGSITVVRKKD
jgi:uncharacterized membrane protein YcaP (DUF421 family)